MTMNFTVEVSGKPEALPVPESAISVCVTEKNSIEPAVADATVTVPVAFCVVPLNVAVTKSEPVQPCAR